VRLARFAIGNLSVAEDFSRARQPLAPGAPSPPPWLSGPLPAAPTAVRGALPALGTPGPETRLGEAATRGARALAADPGRQGVRAAIRVSAPLICGRLPGVFPPRFEQTVGFIVLALAAQPRCAWRGSRYGAAGPLPGTASVQWTLAAMSIARGRSSPQSPEADIARVEAPLPALPRPPSRLRHHPLALTIVQRSSCGELRSGVDRR
jgi:hypothetical protein